jgi:hypothetical protein
MLFKDAQLPGIRAGTTTQTYRRWRSPRVRVDGVYRLRPDLAVRVTALREWTQPFSSRDARAAGFDDVAALERALAAFQRATRLYRVDFERCDAPPDPRRLLAASSPTNDDVEGIRMKLAAMDRRTDGDAWTTRVLRAIEREPGRRAGDLAAAIGWPTPVFKTRVRRLKALGLTESLEVGYRLSSRGRRYVDCLD